MTLYNARITALSAIASDAKMLVNSKDALGRNTAATDFVFDALNPACYAGGALPAVSAAIPAAVFLGATILAGGSGGTNGTFPLAISGGGGSGAAGTFTVAGGALVDISPTAQGGGYTSNVALSFAASAGLTGVSVAVAMGCLLNAARDVQPVLSRTKPLGAFPFTFASRPTFDGKGLAFVNGTTVALNLLKVGTPSNRVCEPPFEGFVDYLEVVIFKATSFPVANSGLLMLSNGGGGVQFSTAGVPASKDYGAAIGPAVPTGQIVTVAKLVRFNTGAGTSTITGYVGIGANVTVTGPNAGKATASYNVNQGGAVTIIGGANGAANASFNGSLYYLRRDLVGLTGQTDAEVLALVTALHTAGLARYA